MTKKQFIYVIIPGIMVVLLSIFAVILVLLDNDDKPTGGYISTSSSTTIESTQDSTETDTSFEEPTASTTVEPDTTTEEETTFKDITTTPAPTTTKKPQEPTEETTTEDPTARIEADLSAYINENGNTIKTRFNVPKGFKRVLYENGSFSTHIQNLPLKPYGSKIYVFDGTEKDNQTWNASVIDLELTSNGWMQCADCVIKLIADYLYYDVRYGDITFDLSSGLTVPYSKWANGYRIILNDAGNKAWLEKRYDTDTSEKTYLRYLNNIFCYANTTSLQEQKESIQLDIENIFPGAYFIVGPDRKNDKPLGHAIMVVDVAKNPDTGEIAFLLAQGNTPSENMHIFTNPLHYDDPWYYSSELGSKFSIPFRDFITKNLYYYSPLSIPKVIS